MAEVALFFSPFFPPENRTDAEGKKSPKGNSGEEKKWKIGRCKKIAAAGKKGEIRRSKKLKELPCTLLQSTDFLENWAQILSDLELQDRAQTELNGLQSSPPSTAPSVNTKIRMCRRCNEDYDSSGSKKHIGFCGLGCKQLQPKKKRIIRKKCPHGRQRSTCKQCGGGEFCKHDSIRSKCKQCFPERYKAHREVQALREVQAWLFACSPFYWLFGCCTIGYWLLTTGYWLLTTGYWLLAIDYWLLAIVYW